IRAVGSYKLYAADQAGIARGSRDSGDSARHAVLAFEPTEWPITAEEGITRSEKPPVKRRLGSEHAPPNTEKAESLARCCGRKTGTDVRHSVVFPTEAQVECE